MDRSGAAIRSRLHATIAALFSRGGLGLVQRPPPHDGITSNSGALTSPRATCTWTAKVRMRVTEEKGVPQIGIPLF